ncbi:MAG: protease modulator HflK [Planctomycetota bacterium]|nr:protease modulator HflK [Planctomycetota bacterium]
MSGFTDAPKPLDDTVQRREATSGGTSPFDPAAPQPSRWLVPCGLAVAIAIAWACSGIFVVGADEAAVVQVFGRAERTVDGVILLRNSGLYFHLPWPMTRVERVRMNEVRTVTVGSSELENLDAAGQFLQAIDPSQQSQLLSGDKNILHVQLNVSYRIANDRIDDWLFGSTVGEQQLQLLASSVLADVVLRSGVDFVHTLGHNEIRQAVLERLEELVEQNSLGVEVEDVTLASVAPPVRVKADFVDVMNARADRETYVNRARAYESQRLSDAQAESARLKNEARSYARRKVDLGRAEAESFNLLIDQLVEASSSSSTSYAEVRQLALRRQFIDTLEDVFRKVDAKVLLDSGQQVDITLHRNPNGQNPGR